ncbi:hypothetical protein SRHO_G00263520 [Serrasalmus rhombeus]
MTYAILTTAGFFIPPPFPHAWYLGMEQYLAPSHMSVMSLADVLGRLVCGWLTSLRVLRNLQLLAITASMLGVVLLLLPLGRSYWPLMIFSALCGFLHGCMLAAQFISIIDIVGLGSFDSALGLYMLMGKRMFLLFFEYSTTVKTLCGKPELRLPGPSSSWLGERAHAAHFL